MKNVSLITIFIIILSPIGFAKTEKLSIIIFVFILYFLIQHHVDPAIGVYVIDRYTYYALEFLEKVTPTSTKTIGDFVSTSLFI